VLALEKTLRQEVPQLTSAISIADLLDAGTGGLDRLEFGATLVIRGGLSLMRARMPEFIDAIYQAPPTRTPATRNNAQLRIMLRSPERLEASDKTQVIERVRNVVQASFPSAEVTGSYVLLTQLIESLLRDQWTTFGVAAVAILAMMAVAFRSLGLALGTLIPNALPVVWLFGAMGLVGVRVNMGAAMIAAVSLGLSVDGSIHYVMSYQRERRGGASVASALRAVHSTVGRAAVFATLALVIGFATLCYSDFVPTIYFGALVSLSMIGGLIGNLLVLPLLIQFVDRGDDTDADISREQRIGPPRSHVADVDHTRVNEDRVKL
jgi:predicted RND superfamily exporter protein